MGIRNHYTYSININHLKEYLSCLGNAYSLDQKSILKTMEDMEIILRTTCGDKDMIKFEFSMGDNSLSPFPE